MKKQGFGMWLSLLAILVSVFAFIVYSDVIIAGNGLLIASGSEPFYDSGIEAYGKMMDTVSLYTLVAVALLVVAMIIGQCQWRIFNIIVSFIRVAVPAVFMIVLLGFLEGSFTGLGWTFFSNEELEIYAEAIAVGKEAIIALVAFAAAMVLSLFANFFAISKKVVKAVKVEE